jgi:hypothetical protein
VVRRWGCVGRPERKHGNIDASGRGAAIYSGKLNHEQPQISKNSHSKGLGLQGPVLLELFFYLNKKIFRCSKTRQRFRISKPWTPPQVRAPEIRIKHPNIREQAPKPTLLFSQNSTRDRKELSHANATVLRNCCNKSFRPERPRVQALKLSTPITHGKSFTTDSSGLERVNDARRRLGSSPEIQMKRSALL